MWNLGCAESEDWYLLREWEAFQLSNLKGKGLKSPLIKYSIFIIKFSMSVSLLNHKGTVQTGKYSLIFLS